MKYYQGQEVLEKLKRGEYPFPKEEITIRVRHGGAFFDTAELETYCLPYDLKLKVVEIVKFADSVDYVSVFEKSLLPGDGEVFPSS